MPSAADEVSSGVIEPTASALDGPSASSIEESFDLATRRARTSARRSKKALVLYSGPYARPDGLGAFLNRDGIETELIDNDAISGGGNGHDVLTLTLSSARSRLRRATFYGAPPEAQAAAGRR